MRIIACCLLLLAVIARAADAPLRPLWARAETSGYVTSWFVCGPFSAERAAVTLERDYLRAWGSTGAGCPAAGALELRADGMLLPWTAYTVKEKPAKPAPAGKTAIPTDASKAKTKTPPVTVDLADALGRKLPDKAVVYAYTVLPREEAGSAYLALDRNAGITVWLNGRLVYDERSPRTSPTPVLPAAWQVGDNYLLVRLEVAATTPNFTLRVLEEPAAHLTANARGPRELLAALEADGLTLTVHTGDHLTEIAETGRTLAVRVAGAGGRTVAAQEIRYGASATFDADAWPDGGYDITCRLLPLPANREDPQGDATPVITHFLWYKGDALAAARQLVTSAPRAAGDDPTAMVHRLLADLIRDRLGDDFANTAKLQEVKAALMEWEELQAPARDATRRSEFFTRLAYRDTVDDSPQFARVYLPPGYDPARRYPLIVMLHGMNRDNPPYLRWGGAVQRYDGLADRYGVIVVYPFGRANAWYRGLGDRDVLRALALTQQHCSVDPDRIYLMGYSMGGAGVWHVGAAHPELFAALAPYYGGREPQVTTPKAELEKFSPREKRYAERDSSFAQAESLLTTPIFISHGDQDKMVPIEITRHGVRLLHLWNYPVTYAEIPGKGHERLDTEDEVLPWLLAQRRVAAPTRVRLRAGSLTTAGAHWVRVLQREKAEAFVQADAWVVTPSLLRLDTDNVLAVRLTPGALVEREKLRIVWNGQEVRPAAMDETGITLYARDYAPQPGEKTAGVEGPIGDIFNTPFLIVIGASSPDPAMRAYCRRYAQREIAWWRAFQQVTPRIVLDIRLTAEDCARYSLLLIGGPEENLIARQFANRLPLAITPAGFVIDEKIFPVRDGGVRLIRPHPLNPERYLVIAAANSPAGMYRLTPFNNRCDVDYLVSDGREGKELAAGLFDRNWRLDDKLLERNTAKGNLPGVPRDLTMPATGKRVYLSEVLEHGVEGDFDYLTGVFNNLIGPARLGGARYARSLRMGYYSNAKSAVEYQLPGETWRRFRAVIGLESPPSKGTVVFVIKADGKEVYRSPAFAAKAAPRRLDIPLEGVSILRLEMEWNGNCAGSTACWGDARVEQ